MANETNILEVEIRTFEKMRVQLEKTYPNKFVVIKGDMLVGAWDTLDAAAAEAVRRFGRGPYLIRQVGAPPPVIPASVLFHNVTAV